MVAPEGSTRATVRAKRPAHDPSTIELTIAGRIDRTDAARFGREVRSLLDDGGAARIVCDIGSVSQSDVAVVDALCRMRLAARRRGSQLVVRNASRPLLDLIDLIGLTGILPVADSRGEVDGQPEEREHPLRVEEERDPADPTA